MEELDTPVDIGAKYKINSDNEIIKYIRVTRIWVDESFNTHIEFDKTGLGVTESSDEMSLKTLIEKINNGELVRQNSDNEAWRWRHERSGGDI